MAVHEVQYPQDDREAKLLLKEDLKRPLSDLIVELSKKGRPATQILGGVAKGGTPWMVSISVGEPAVKDVNQAFVDAGLLE